MLQYIIENRPIVHWVRIYLAVFTLNIWKIRVKSLYTEHAIIAQLGILRKTRDNLFI